MCVFVCVFGVGGGEGSSVRNAPCSYKPRRWHRRYLLLPAVCSSGFCCGAQTRRNVMYNPVSKAHASIVQYEDKAKVGLSSVEDV